MKAQSQGEQKRTGTFKVVGLSAPASFTLYESDDHCWAKSGLPEEKYKELFNMAKKDDNFWKQDVIATVEYDDLGVHNSPINGIVINVTINSIPLFDRSPN